MTKADAIARAFESVLLAAGNKPAGIAIFRQNRAPKEFNRNTLFLNIFKVEESVGKGRGESGGLGYRKPDLHIQLRLECGGSQDADSRVEDAREWALAAITAGVTQIRAAGAAGLFETGTQWPGNAEPDTDREMAIVNFNVTYATQRGQG